MKANELRIGNWVKYFKENESKVNQICGSYVHLSDASSIFLEELEPIPLTEEWLTKLGFKGKYKSVHTHWNYKGFGIDQKSDEDDFGGSIPIEQVFYYQYMYDIKYVHQLQNLYFVLTGNELEQIP